MNDFYAQFIELGRQLAEERGVSWLMPVDAKGRVTPDAVWNLSQLSGKDLSPRQYLNNFGCEAKALQLLNADRASSSSVGVAPFVLSMEWQNLIKAAAAIQLFVKRNSAAYALHCIVRPLRVIATTSLNKPPWTLVYEDIRLAVRIGKAVQAGGKLGDLVAGIVKIVFDTNHLMDAGPLYPALANQRLKAPDSKVAKFTKSEEEIRHDLEERKLAEKLPERRAFWELIRIVMTEKPKSFVDELRFIAIKTQIVSGFRAGEGALLPVDWKRQREYVDRNGQPAGSLGGVSSALMIRHFAEKQQESEGDSAVLTEETQYVPQMFEELISEALGRAAELTSPLRKTLRLQVETGRLLPWFGYDDVVPITQLYTHLTGNPFWVGLAEEECASWVNKYKEGFDFSIFDELQCVQGMASANGMPVDRSFNRHFIRIGKKLPFRLSDGTVLPLGSRIKCKEFCLHVGELEEYIRTCTPAKVPDLASFKLETGNLQPWELLFLGPKYSYAEERNNSICDVTRYMSVDVLGVKFIYHALTQSGTTASVFDRYGQTEEDRKLEINPHALRHLQNTELFRLGIADTIISKRFNRRSVSQSYEYDHRSLAEELSSMEIPLDVEFSLGEKATTVAKLIMSGKAHGPIVDAFKRIQASEGDAAAFEYLKAEADGFHATPYGHCLNSFTVDPCPKHLECFSGCRHLSATNLPEHRAALIRLEGKLAAALELAQARSSTSIGRDNQIRHAAERLEGVRRILMVHEGEHPFPDGPDLSKPGDLGVMDE